MTHIPDNPPPEDPRRKAHQYKEERPTSGEPPAPQDAPRKPRSEGEWRDAVSQAIEEAMRQGDFDNLPGRGKPLKLDRDPFVPEGAELAYGLMKNNDLVPGWIGARNELLREIERWRSRTRATAARFAAEQARATTPAAQEALRSRWLAQRETLRAEADAYNRRIRDLNLQQPIRTMELFMLRLDDELHKAGAPAIG